MTNEERDELLIRMETTLGDMKLRLFGNGQPGEIDKLENRIIPLEKYKAAIGGALALLASLVSVIGGALIKHLFFPNKP